MMEVVNVGARSKSTEACEWQWFWGTKEEEKTFHAVAESTLFRYVLMTTKHRLKFAYVLQFCHVIR